MGLEGWRLGGRKRSGEGKCVGAEWSLVRHCRVPDGGGEGRASSEVSTKVTPVSATQHLPHKLSSFTVFRRPQHISVLCMCVWGVLSPALTFLLPFVVPGV